MNISFRPRHLIITALGVAVVAGGVYAGIFRKIYDYAGSALGTFLVPWRSFSVKMENENRFFQNRSEFFAAYRQCVETLTDSAALEARLELVMAENQRLREQLSFQTGNERRLVLADVVGTEQSGNEQIIIINRGTSDGAIVGVPIIVGKGTVVGKIIRVENNQSFARLILDPKSRLEATVINEDRTLGIVEGGFGVSLRMMFVPRNENILVNQAIVTSGRDQLIPRGLFIGTVTAVENEAYQGFQRITLSPGTDLTKLTEVSLVLPSQSP